MGESDMLRKRNKKVTSGLFDIYVKFVLAPAYENRWLALTLNWCFESFLQGLWLMEKDKTSTFSI